MSTRRRHYKSGPRFAAVYHWVMDSPAFLSLSGNAIKVLLHVWRRHNGANNGQIVSGCRDARQIGLSAPTASRALAELVDAGFLKVIRDSAFRMKSKEAREWALTMEPIGDQPATKDFMRSQPTEKDSTVSPVKPSVSPVKPSIGNGAENGPENGPTVSRVKPSNANLSQSRFHGRYTSISTTRAGDQTSGSAPATSRQPKGPPRFGDRAKAERIARNPDWVEAIAAELAARDKPK